MSNWPGLDAYRCREPPPILWRVIQDTTQSSLSPAEHLLAKDSTRLLLSELDFYEAVQSHLDWFSRNQSCFLSTFDNETHALHWALDQKSIDFKGLGQENIEILRIDATELVRCTDIFLASAFSALGGRQPNADEVLVLHGIPRHTILDRTRLDEMHHPFLCRPLEYSEPRLPDDTYVPTSRDLEGHNEWNASNSSNLRVGIAEQHPLANTQFSQTQIPRFAEDSDDEGRDASNDEVSDGIAEQSCLERMQPSQGFAEDSDEENGDAMSNDVRNGTPEQRRRGDNQQVESLSGVVAKLKICAVDDLTASTDAAEEPVEPQDSDTSEEQAEEKAQQSLSIDSLAQPIDEPSGSAGSLDSAAGANTGFESDSSQGSSSRGQAPMRTSIQPSTAQELGG